MNGLIVEDDRNKLLNISTFLRKNILDLNLVESYSYQGGLKQIRYGSFDFVLLDMSLPNYDITAEESGFRFRQFAGTELLDEMRRLRLVLPSFVVTQFDTFGEGVNTKALIELDHELALKFPEQYKGAIFYSPSEEAWKTKLLNAIEKLKS